MNQVNKQVNQTINQNKITLKDIRTRKKHWNHPGSEKYQDLVFYSGWKWWTKKSKFFPTPDKYIEIREETIKLLENLPNQSKKEDRILKTSYYLIRNHDNIITFILQNVRSYDLLDPYNVLFFRKQLYFITSVDYIDDKILYCQITAQRDLFWAYYGNFCNSRGTALITSSQLGQDHGKHEDDWNKQDEDNCWACESCYSYCDDLRIKKAKKGGLKNDQEIGWQPKWGIVYADLAGELLAGGSIFTLPESAGELGIPDGIILKKLKSTLRIDDPFYNTPKLIFLVDKEHSDKQNILENTFSVPSFYTKEYLNQEYPLPNIFNQKPHLLNHSSTQFYFQKKLLFTANLRHVKVRRKEGNFHLIYNIRIRSSVSGVLYYFESGEIYFRWEIRVQGQVSNNKLLGMINKALYGTISGVASKLAKKIGSRVLSAIPVVGGLLSGVAEGLADEAEAYQKSLADRRIPKIKEMFNAVGLKIVDEPDKPEQEAQTERKKKSTAKRKKKEEETVDPSIFYSSTIDFCYDLWEFANRSIRNPFEVRFEHSDLLLSNLYNNNNASPIHNIDCRFSQFKQIIKVGDFQATVDLFYDYNNFWKEICGRGVYFYQNIEEEFKPYKPVFRLTQSSQFKAISNIEVTIGEEKIVEADKIEIVASGQTGDVGYAHSTFLRTANRSQLQYLKNVHGSVDHWNEEYGWCWGCFSHGINTHGGDGTEHTCLGTFDPTEDTDIEFYLKKNDQVTKQVAKCYAGKSYTVILKRAGTTLDVYFKYIDRSTIYKEEKVQMNKEQEYTTGEWKEEEIKDDNTQFASIIGEVDSEGLEGEIKDFETEEKGFDKPENLKEGTGTVEKEFQKELEKQKELQKQLEMERQLEKDLEKEKERKQRESDFDREKDRLEQEKTRERLTREAKVRERLAERLRERLEREAKTRERLRQREQERKDKEKKDKERKERE